MTKHFRPPIFFALDLFHCRRLICQLALQDIRTRYLGSYLGILWAFIQPTITVLIFWFVFECGFKFAPVENFPFILWLVCGIVPWFFVADSIAGATGSILESSYLVNKVVFRVSILPVVKVFSSLVVHLFFLAVTVGLFWLYGFRPNLYYLQVVYYLTAMAVLVTGISWATSALVVFLKDIGQVVAMLLQFGFWLTPIFWPIASIPAKYQAIVKLNPFYYVVEGYRATFINQRWFWEDGGAAAYFWLTALTVLFLGAAVFRRLRPHFADML